jgi:hypothetical protein
LGRGLPTGRYKKLACYEVLQEDMQPESDKKNVDELHRVTHFLLVRARNYVGMWATILTFWHQSFTFKF